MDGNKDAAEKCMNIAKKALKDGDKHRAHHFLSKALRLNPNLPLGELLSSLSAEIGAGPDSNGGSPGKQTFVHSRASTSAEGSSNHNAPTVDFSTEQAEIVRRIRKTNDYYEILGLEKGCSLDEIKKAYKKVSLKVHPDKNKAPGAEEAFKAVTKAFACLSDPELRKRYDFYGSSEENEIASHQNTFRHHNGGFVFEEMFDANEIFNAFFNGMPGGTSFVRTYGSSRQPTAQRVYTQELHVGSLVNLLQLLPLIMLLLFSISNLLSFLTA